MPVVLTVPAALGALAYWSFRLRDVSHVVGGAVDSAGRIRGAYRRKRFRTKAESSPIDAVDDPAAAAVAMLVALAAPSGRPSDRAAAAIKADMRDVMGVPQIEELFTFARWVAEHASDPNHLSLRLSKLWLTRLSPEQRADLYGMASRVVAVDGPPSDLQRESLARLKDRLGLTRV